MSWIQQLSCRRVSFFLARLTSTFCRTRLPYMAARWQLSLQWSRNPNIRHGKAQSKQDEDPFHLEQGTLRSGLFPNDSSDDNQRSLIHCNHRCTVRVCRRTTQQLPYPQFVNGIVNAISWGVLLPTGAAIARYLRHIKSLVPAWFYAHAGTQLFAFFLGTVGFATGIRFGEISSGVAYGKHRKLGFAACGLGAIQTMAVLFWPKTTHVFRKYWKSYHHFDGYACVIIGVVNVFQGFEAMCLGRSYAKITYCLCLSTLIGVYVSMEVNNLVIFCRESKEEKMRREGLIGTSEKESGSFR